MADEAGLTTKQKEVVSVLKEGRTTPKHIVDNSTPPSKHSAQDHLRNLRIAGVVEKVNRGLYQLGEDESRTSAGDRRWSTSSSAPSCSSTSSPASTSSPFVETPREMQEHHPNVDVADEQTRLIEFTDGVCPQKNRKKQR